MNSFWSTRTLGAQIAILSAVLLAVTTSVAAIINILNLQNNLKDDLLRHGLALGQSLSSPLSYDLVRDEFDSIEISLLNSAEFPDVASLKLIDINGVVLSHIIKNENNDIRVSFAANENTLPEKLKNIQTPIFDFGPDVLEIWYPLKTSIAVGWLNINFSYKELETLYRDVIYENVIAAFFIIIIDVVFILLVLVKPTKKIRHAINLAQELDAIHPQQTKVSGRSRELNELFSALNGAAARLTKQHQKIEAQTTQLQASQAEAEAANKAKSEFLSSMSHELRTPLNAILGFSQLLELNEEDGLKKQNIQEIIHAGNYLLTLINEVLELAKIESGNTPLSISDYNLNKLLNDSLSIIKPAADKREINIINKISSSTNPYILIDEVKFRQIMLNLLSNAVKYNAENGEIIIQCSPIDENKLQLSVTDTGRGLSPEQLDHIFRPFDRIGAEASGIEGTGLGLVISKDLIELMNGEIGVESELGKGSRFWLNIPLSPVQTSLF